MKIKNIILLTFIICSFNLKASYYQQIQPIFNQFCTSCHIGNFASGGLDLTSYEKLIQGGNSGDVIIAGNAQSSLLWTMINSGYMPLYEPNLEQENVDLIGDWINQDARVCDDGFAYHPEVADNLETEYINVTIQDQEYNPCFYEADIEALEDIIIINEFQNTTDSFKLGTQTWNNGRLRFLVAGYYFNGVEEIIHTIPESIGQLDDLRSLYLEWNEIEILPDSFTNLTKLVNLYISNNQLIALPENFGNLTNLYILDLGYNQLSAIPESITNLEILSYLWLFNNQITALPENFCDLNLNWDDNDTFGYPYFAIGGNMLCENIPDCVENSAHFNTSLEQYYYSVQITVEQECDWLDIDNEENSVDFQLNKIYPNPFNPSANINFSLKESEKISILIFDLNGRLINTLLSNQKMEPGNHNVIWNASLIPSGIYFVKISNGEKVYNQKIILQK